MKVDANLFLGVVVGIVGMTYPIIIFLVFLYAVFWWFYGRYTKPTRPTEYRAANEEELNRIAKTFSENNHSDIRRERGFLNNATVGVTEYPGEHSTMKVYSIASHILQVFFRERIDGSLQITGWQPLQQKMI